MVSLSLSIHVVRELTVALRSRLRLLATAAALALASSAGSATVVAIVSSKSAITTLTKVQMLDVFLGRVTLFPDGTRAIPIDEPEGSAVRDEFYARLADKSAAQMKAYWSKIIFTGRGQPPKVRASGAEVKQQIAADPRAIGYIDETLVDDSVRVLR
jgi:ABC-type phosphate transport system substrate-binding protein